MIITRKEYDRMVSIERHLTDSLTEANGECEALRKRLEVERARNECLQTINNQLRYKLEHEEKDMDHYRWHDYLRNPKDIPEVYQMPGDPDIILSNVVNVLYDLEGSPEIVTALYLNGRFVYSGMPDEGEITIDIKDAVAWQYIRIPEMEYTEVETDEHEDHA